MSKCFWSGQCMLAGMWSSSQSDEWRMLCISTMKFKSQRETWSHSYSLVFSKTSAVISSPPPPLHTPPCEGRSRCTFLSIPPTPFRTGLPSITLTAICSRIFHMALRWKTLRNRVVLGTGGNRKVLPDPNSDPDKNSFLPLSCSLSSGLQPGNKAGRGSCTFSPACLHVLDKQPLSIQQLKAIIRSVLYGSLALRTNHISETSRLYCPCDIIHICCSRQA